MKVAERMRTMIIPSVMMRSWMKHTLAWCDENGAMRLDYRPVKLQTLTNEVSVYSRRRQRVY